MSLRRRLWSDLCPCGKNEHEYLWLELAGGPSGPTIVPQHHFYPAACLSKLEALIQFYQLLAKCQHGFPKKNVNMAQRLDV
jgi:hypothetical protein